MTHVVLAAFPTLCDRCETIVPRGGRFVVGRQRKHFCLACWEAEHE